MSSVVISGNTSGSVTLAAPDVAGTTTLTLPATSGTVMVNGPAFSATFSGVQSVTSNTITKVTLNTEVFDTNNNYDPTTNYRFTPTVAGYYQISFTVNGTANAGTCQVVNAIPYKNGTTINGILYAYGSYLYATAVNGGASTGSLLVYMNGSTDYLELYAKVIGTSPYVDVAFMSAFLARSA